MDKRELLQATLDGEKTDRIPCGFWHHFDKDSKYGTASVKAHLNYYDEVKTDVFKVMNEHLYKLDYEVKNPQDWAKTHPIIFEDSPYVEFIEECRTIKKNLPSDLPLFATFHGIMVSACHATEGVDRFSNPNNVISSHLREDPETVFIGLKAIADTLIETAKHVKKIGLDGVYYAALGGEDYRFTSDLLEKYVVSLDKYVIDAINDMGMKTILHICKDKLQLPSYGCINADVVNWDVHDCKYSLKDGREIFKNKTLLGGFDDRSGVLVDGTEKEIIKEYNEILKTAGREKLIIGTDCTLPPDINTHNLNIVTCEARK